MKKSCLNFFFMLLFMLTLEAYVFCDRGNELKNNNDDFLKLLNSLSVDKATLVALSESPHSKEMFAAINTLVDLDLFRQGDGEQILLQEKHAHTVLQALTFLSTLWDPINQETVSPTRRYASIALRYTAAMDELIQGEDLGIEILMRKLIRIRTAWSRGEGEFIKDLFFYSPFMQRYFNNMFAVGGPSHSEQPRIHLPHILSSHDFLKKEDALAFFIEKVRLLMLDPVTACQYLMPLEQKLRSLLGEKRLSAQVDPDVFRFAPFMGTFYPVPNEKFKQQSNNHLLTRALKALMEVYGLGKAHLTLVGFVPSRILSGLLMQGFFISEYTSDSHFLLMHGKKIHPLQMLLIGFFLDNHVYYEHEKRLTLQDVVAHLMLNEGDLWVELLDGGMTDGSVGFSTPYYMHTFLMKNGAQHGLSELQAVLLLSYLNSYRRCLAAHEEKFDAKFSDEEFWQLMTLTRSNVIEHYWPKDYCPKPRAGIDVYSCENTATEEPFFILSKARAEQANVDAALKPFGLKRLT